MVAYVVRSKLAFSVVTLSFIRSSPMKSNPNQTINLAIRSRLSFLVKMSIHPPTAISGRAIVEILKSPNPSSAASKGNIGDPIFAQKTTPTAFASEMMPAPANASTSNEVRLLLCIRVVVRAPVKIALRRLVVYFWSRCLSFFPPRKFNACSKLCIPYKSMPIPANNNRRSKFMYIEFRYK